MADRSTPFGIDRDRHIVLHGRARHVWQRRVALAVVAAIPLLGLLNVFGQRAAVTEGRANQATLLIDSPARVRGGLIFTTRLTVISSAGLSDARLYFAPGWFQAMTFNGIVPQPSAQFSVGDWVVLDFGKIKPGRRFSLWISWQTNPTNVGRRARDVALYDADRQLVVVHRTITVFP